MTKAFTTGKEKGGIRLQDNPTGKKTSKTVTQFIDSRPETLLQRKLYHMANKGATAMISVQKKPVLEEEELLQGKLKTLQRQNGLEEEEPLQGKFKTIQRKELEEKELRQGKFNTVQRQKLEEEEILQGKFEPPQVSGQAIRKKVDPQRSRRENNTGLPDNLKSGIENLSGYAMDDVKVHYKSDKPAQLNAHAYAQGTDIHLASGQEKHLPHETWHVVQQKQGRVKPTLQMKGKVNVNDDVSLEKEADVMGLLALTTLPSNEPLNKPAKMRPLLQRKKTKRPEWNLLKNVMSSAAKGKNSEEEKSEAVWKECVTHYSAAREKGNNLQRDLEERAWQFALGKDEMKLELEEKRQRYDSRYADSYITKVRDNKGNGPVSVSTVGFTDQHPVSKDKMTGQYDNRIDLSTGTIIADNNKATEDPAREANQGLSNSEILWNQYREVAVKKLDKAEVAQSLANISKVIRANVVNEISQQVVFMAYDDGEPWIGGETREWKPDDNEYSAILGTPNAAAVAFMLIDHFDELGEKKLGTIKTESVGPHIEINFNEPENDQGKFTL